MAGRKRAADSDSPPTTRAAKAAKTSGTASKGKKGPKTNLSTTAFKSKALPLHVNITHTPPAVIEDETTVPAHTADPGFLGAVTLLPNAFSTGSYGWKGSKRIIVEVDHPEGDDKEKLQVQLTINATVMGSKSAKGEEAEDDEGKADVEKVEKADAEEQKDDEQ